ncbi:hypothetical protein ACH5RR_033205 [Cinchona calisaya]|uniref:NADP-dependent oxidoreductase domain-containing protein n=1 Tax=Cinchona calisaya TaxID=153742 RepID=A0ABD2YKC4_9GENT
MIQEAFNRGITFFDIADAYGGNETLVGKPTSLKRLDIDYIDLYYQHKVDVSMPIEETMEKLRKLVKEGKIKYIGLYEASMDTTRRAYAVHPITAIKMEYSLLTREIEQDIVPLCRELGTGIMAYSSLGHGFFGGKAVVEDVPSKSLLVWTTKLRNLENNIGSLALKFTNEDLDEIFAAIPIDGMASARDLESFSKYDWKLATVPPRKHQVNLEII